MPISKKTNTQSPQYPSAKSAGLPNDETTFSRGLCRVVAAVTMVNGRENPEPVSVAVACFNEKNGKSCEGDIIVTLEDTNGVIDWYCDTCERQGEIDSWQEGFFDCSDFQRTHVH